MTGWPELVTTALLGTGRRPVPSGISEIWATSIPADQADPAVRLLDLAARHRAAQSGGHLDRRSRPPNAVRRPRPLRRRIACRHRQPRRRCSVRCWSRPTPALVNFWLGCAEATGCGVPLRYWTRLARLAAHSTAYDRPLLGRVLGERGRWFLRQNPDWRRLAADAEAVPVDRLRA